ncbi:hypothetical protein HYT52_00040 [Candidatus Woesearchaeota archaeon]|nr:hypothetical protein [Candidatus Woesearchaeota archaeon]
MINLKEQEELFQLISDYLEKDLTCIAIGGTAMMFSGYKTTTKDIDLVFKNNKERDIFVKAIYSLGYRQKTLKGIYDEKRIEHQGKPIMFTRVDERFDLFVENIFGFKLDFSDKNIVQKQVFSGKKKLTLVVLPKEYIILLKSVTSRPKDFEDIVTIINLEKEVDWDLIINEAFRQEKNNSWIVLDLEETMLKLKKFIPKDYIKRLYEKR